MKKIKLGICSSLLLPVVAAPMVLSSCSVYKDLMTEYKPNYEQYKGVLTLEQATNKWFEKAKEISNFIEQETFWGYSLRASSTQKDIPTYVEGITYSSEFTVFSASFSNAKISNYDNHELTYKVNVEIERKFNYTYKGEYIGYGIRHYSVDWDVQNIQFDVCKDTDTSVSTKDFWLVKPSIFVYDEESEDYTWTRYLQNDERIAFNIRYLIEIYNANGIQAYGYETTEAAVMDKDLSYVAELNDIIEYFCCFWSYYLNDCIVQ